MGPSSTTSTATFPKPDKSMSKESNIISLEQMRRRLEKQIEEIKAKLSNYKHGIGDRYVLTREASAQIREIRAKIERINDSLEVKLLG